MTPRQAAVERDGRWCRVCETRGGEHYITVPGASSARGLGARTMAVCKGCSSFLYFGEIEVECTVPSKGANATLRVRAHSASARRQLGGFGCRESRAMRVDEKNEEIKRLQRRVRSLEGRLRRLGGIRG